MFSLTGEEFVLETANVWLVAWRSGGGAGYISRGTAKNGVYWDLGEERICRIFVAIYWLILDLLVMTNAVLHSGRALLNEV